MENKKRSEKFNSESQVVDLKAEKKRKKKEKKKAEKTTQMSQSDINQVQRRRKQKRRRFFLYAVVIIALLAIVGFSGYRIVVLKMEESQLRKEQARLEQEKKDKEEELQMVNDPEYIEQQARKQLRMIMPGETLYMLPSKEDLEKAGEKTNNE